MIFASILDRFGFRFGNQVGTMLVTFVCPRYPKRPPRRPKTPNPSGSWSITFALLNSKTPQDAPRSIFGGFLIDFCLISHRFLIDVLSIFSLIFERFLVCLAFACGLSCNARPPCSRSAGSIRRASLRASSRVKVLATWLSWLPFYRKGVWRGAPPSYRRAPAARAVA